MSLDVFNAVVKGYTNHLFDLQVISVQTGYWAGYYTRAKKPKPLKSVISNVTRSKNKEEKTSRKGVKASEVNVDAFLAMEQKFQEKMQKQNTSK